MTCVDGWKEDDGCGHDDNIGCDEANDDSVCRCKAAPSCDSVSGWDKKTKCHGVCACKDNSDGHHDIVCNKVGEVWPDGCDFTDLDGMASPNWVHNSPGGEIHITGNSKLKTLPTKLFHGTSTYHIRIFDNQALETLPDDLFYDAETLFLQIDSNPKLKKVPKDLFEGLKSTARRKMDVIRFSSNGLTELPAGMFKGAHINLLYLMNNKITEFASGLFEGLSIYNGLLVRGEKELEVIKKGAYQGILRCGQFQITGCDKLVKIEVDALKGVTTYVVNADNNKALEYFGSNEGATFSENINLQKNPSLKVMPGKARNQKISGLQYDDSGVITTCDVNDAKSAIVCKDCKANSGLSIMDDGTTCRLTTTLTTTTGTTTTGTTTTVPFCKAGFKLDERANTCVDCPDGQFQSNDNHQSTRHGALVLFVDYRQWCCWYRG